LSEEQWNSSNLFKLFDKDQSGSLDFDQFTDMCKYMGLFLTREQRLKLFSQADESGNGAIEYDGI
jgi:Ca2+-binding EF-hand superfamily protein